MHGPTAVNGTLRVSGAKNSVLKLMAATLLAEGESTITNVPEIHDVTIMAELLRRLGCGVVYERAEKTVRIDVPAVLHHQAAVPGVLEQGLCRVDELVVEVPGEGLAGVVREDAHEHDGVVLPRGPRRVLLAHVLADDARALGCGRGGRLGGVDDGGQKEHLVALGVAAGLAKSFLQRASSVSNAVSVSGYCHDARAVAQGARTTLL